MDNVLLFAESKIITSQDIKGVIARLRLRSQSIVFTNGCFDLLHRGHLEVLSQSKKAGDALIVGVNSDASVKRLKGESRPVQDEQSRALILAALQVVDFVIIFEEDTPLDLIRAILPDVLVKGGDYTTDTIVGASDVIANGGVVKTIPLREGYSTTALIGKSGI